MSRTLGFATASVLHAIRSGRRYGLDIIDETGLGGGTIYKLLHRLEERGFVTGVWEDPDIAERERRPRRRYYQLTRDGGAALADALRRYGSLTGQRSGKDALAGEA
jgi:DNA-binding PadR family transcriptional regulator